MKENGTFNLKLKEVSMSPNAKWQVFHVSGDELETVLNKLCEDEHKIFSVQYIESKWVVITEKVIKEESGKVTMGFGSKR